MAREIIAKTECTFCGKSFDVATEDIEWYALKDYGETDTPHLKDYGVRQNLECPFCCKENKVLITMKGTSESNIDTNSIIIYNDAFYKNP